MKANSEKTKQSKKATRRVLAGVLCGASVLSLVLSLVMPPISQAIANGAQTVPTEGTVMGGGSSSESTDVGSTNNGDTENQNSDDGEGGETGSSNGDEQAQTEDQLEDELQVEDGSSSNDDAVMAAAEGGQTKTAANEIASANDLVSKLGAVEKNGIASFDLTTDVECGSTIQLDESGSNITLNLNGHKIKYTNQSQPLFNITGGATLTIKDLIKDSDSEKDPEKASEKVIKVQELNDQGQNLNPTNYGKAAELSYNNDGIPSNLTYYVTQSSPSATDTTKTTETLYKHSVDIKGAIVACGGNENLKLININGGHFSLENGVLTQEKDFHVQNLVYAENESTVNMNGGYVCGGFCPRNGAGAGISVDHSTLSISNGVIAGNSAPCGGGVYANGSTVTMSGGIISGNSTLDDMRGFGGGIMAEGGSVTVSGGFITNNKYSNYCGKNGWGCHGGAGLAANNGAHVTISGGQITGNYSEEAGGGVYVTNQNQSGMAWLNITGGNIASNVSYRSEGAGIRVGQKVDAMISGASKESLVYITNNHCMSRFDWGGGGIFVQGCLETASNAGRLFVYNSYISSNTAGGYGGGVAVCPTGKTLVTNTDGTAIFGNTDAGSADSYDSMNNDGNPHLSGGGLGKTEDEDAYKSVNTNGEHVFRDSGHADFFLAAKGNNTPVAVVTGKMLGDIDAEYSGSIELMDRITIPANGVAQVKNSIGLTSGVSATDETTTEPARKKATTFITGNYSWDHGGGIMSNGNLYLGVPEDTHVYPSLKLKATKALKNKQTEKEETLTKDQFSFAVYRKDSATATAPSWNNDGFNNGGCTLVGSAKNDANGNITFDLGEQFIEKTAETDKITYYLVEDAGEDSDITYDPAVYEIVVTFEDRTTVLMSVPTQNNPNETKEFKVHNYTIKSMDVIKHSGNSSSTLDNVQPDEDGYYSIGCSDDPKTFTNTYTPYTSTGSWTPKATKVVEGGEMKKFTLEFADNENFTGDSVKTVLTTAGGDNPQTQDFPTINYTLDSLKQSETDVPGRGASKIFTYYMREKDDSLIFSHYKFDKSVYKFTVVATDNSKGTIDYKVTYRKGIVGSDGKWEGTDSADHDLTTSTPTFTNTYSTTLPLSGMSGVTLTYLAGAAVLCAAAAWMHIRRKANAKGGERRE